MKKIYQNPEMEVVKVEPVKVLSGSGESFSLFRETSASTSTNQEGEEEYDNAL